jgi:lysophospholipase L1-like esterase
MSSAAHDSPRPARRALWRRLALSLALSLGLLVVLVEVGSRWADGVVAERRARPDWNASEDAQGLAGKLCLDTLEYGTLKRASEQKNARAMPHPYLGYALRPGFSTPPGAKQQASHNTLGFRGKETTWEKPQGVFRIVTTGGSSVYGQSESNDAAVWSQRLEDHLNERLAPRRFEVVNLGVSGWNSHEMLVNLALRGLDLEPDLVVVHESINDMRCALYTRGGEPTRDNLHWRATWPVDRPSALEASLAKSRAYLVWRRYMTDYVAERSDLGFYAIANYDPQGPDPYRHYPGAIPDLGFETYRRNLRQIVALCRARGAEVMIATQALPRWHLEQAASYREQCDAFERIKAVQREVAAELSVEVCDNAGVLEAALDAELQAEIARRAAAEPAKDRAALEAEAKAHVRVHGLYKWEVHPNDSGSDLVARTIADCLAASPLLQPR